jgi:hypothetical protein
MENPPQFDLNESIQRWRANLEASSAFHATDLNELEGHLRDSITTLQTKELSLEEAFWVATKRLGSQETLCTEFGKVNGERIWLSRALWLVAGSLLIGAIASLSSKLADLATIGIHQFPMQGEMWKWAGALIGLIYLLSYISFLIVVWRSGKERQGWVWRMVNWLKLHPVTTAGILFVVYFVQFFAGVTLQIHAHNFPHGQAYTAFMTWRHYTTFIFQSLLWPAVFAWLLVRYRKALANP